MEIDFEELRQIFLTESESTLSMMEESLIVFESRLDDEEALYAIFRAAHSLKGSASCLGLKSIPEFAHVVEDVLQRMRVHTVNTTEELVTLLLRSVDALRELAAIAGGDGMTVAHQALLDGLTQAADAASGSPSLRTNTADPSSPINASIAAPVVEEIAKAEAQPSVSAQAPASITPQKSSLAQEVQTGSTNEVKAWITSTRRKLRLKRS